MVDFRGQQLNESIYLYSIIVISAISWLIGYSNQDFQITLYGWAGSLVLALVLCIPDWPFYNRNPVKWLNKVGQYKAGIATTGTKLKQKKDK